jgi:beta-phosphoglucomutase
MKPLNTDLISVLAQKKAIFWDFDGCFCDTERIHFSAYRDIFAKYGHEVNESEYYYYFTHLGLGILDEAKRHGVVGLDHITLRQEKVALFKDRIAKGQAHIFPEMPAILDIMAKTHQIYIVSNTSTEEIQTMLACEEVRLGRTLPVTKVFGLQPFLQKKPHPDSYLYALKQLTLEPHQVLVLEDSERGLTASHGAGIQSIWVQTTYNHTFPVKPELYSWRMTHEQLLTILKK